MPQLDFNAILDANKNNQDDYVNATDLAKEFGKTWREFSRAKGTRVYLKALRDKGIKGTRKEKTGRNSCTWIHPLVVIKLAEWLNPEFEIHVKQVFVEYLKGNSDLAVDILTRDRNKERFERAKRRLEVCEANKQVNQLASDYGVSHGHILDTPLPTFHYATRSIELKEGDSRFTAP